MKRINHNKGFTLIELLIVVTIVAILAAISLAIYQDLSIRARVTEGLGLAQPAKTAVSDTVLSTNVLPANQAATGFLTPPATSNVADVSIGANGVVVVTFTAQAGNGTVIFQPTVIGNSGISWDCTGGTLEDRYRPPICR